MKYKRLILKNTPTLSTTKFSKMAYKLYKVNENNRTELVGIELEIHNLEFVIKLIDEKNI